MSEKKDFIHYVAYLIAVTAIWFVAVFTQSQVLHVLTSVDGNGPVVPNFRRMDEMLNYLSTVKARKLTLFFGQSDFMVAVDSRTIMEELRDNRRLVLNLSTLAQNSNDVIRIAKYLARDQGADSNVIEKVFVSISTLFSENRLNHQDAENPTDKLYFKLLGAEDLNETNVCYNLKKYFYERSHFYSSSFFLPYFASFSTRVFNGMTGNQFSKNYFFNRMELPTFWNQNYGWSREKLGQISLSESLLDESQRLRYVSDQQRQNWIRFLRKQLEQDHWQDADFEESTAALAKLRGLTKSVAVIVIPPSPELGESNRFVSFVERIKSRSGSLEILNLGESVTLSAGDYVDFVHLNKYGQKKLNATVLEFMRVERHE